MAVNFMQWLALRVGSPLLEWQMNILALSDCHEGHLSLSGPQHENWTWQKHNLKWKRQRHLRSNALLCKIPVTNHWLQPYIQSMSHKGCIHRSNDPNVYLTMSIYSCLRWRTDSSVCCFTSNKTHNAWYVQSICQQTELPQKGQIARDWTEQSTPLHHVRLSAKHNKYFWIFQL